MKMSDNIILIGFMGAGKTTLGRFISETAGMRYIDTDEYIETSQGMTINNIFAEKGEEYFRELETGTLETLCRGSHGNIHGCIVSAGGGMPVRQKNRELMKKLGTVVYLRAPEEELVRRLENDTKRPMLTGGDLRDKIRELMMKRETSYLDAAELIVDTRGKTMDMMYEEIETYVNDKK